MMIRGALRQSSRTVGALSTTGRIASVRTPVLAHSQLSLQNDFSERQRGTQVLKACAESSLRYRGYFNPQISALKR